jgi:hypothetical protein
MGKGGDEIFIRPESSIRLAKVAYVRYYYTLVQGLSRTFRYYPAVNPKSSVHSILLSIRLCTIHRVRCTICQRMSGGPPAYVCQKVVYVRSRSLISQNAFLIDHNDPKSKLTLLTKLLMPS